MKPPLYIYLIFAAAAILSYLWQMHPACAIAGAVLICVFYLIADTMSADW